jgi:hypothetical protein
MKELTDEQKQLAISYKEVFSGPHGERVLTDLKRHCSYDIVIWKRDTLGRIDPYDVTIRAAKRSLVNHIINQIEKKL